MVSNFFTPLVWPKLDTCVQCIPGTSNEIAEALSRLQDVGFKELVPKANVPAWPVQTCYHGVTKSMRQTYKSGLTAYMSFCSCFNIRKSIPSTFVSIDHNAYHIKF